MSFVLEALRKSEQERQQATAPGLGVLFPAVVEERTTSRARPILITGIAALAIAVLLWFLLRPQVPVPVPPALPKATAAAPEMPKTAVPKVASPVSPLPETRSTIAVAAMPKSAEKLAVLPLAPVSSVRAKTESTQATPKETLGRAFSAAQSAISANARPAVAPPPAEGMPARDVSPAPPKNLPEMTIAGYIHDDQAGSMAMINDKLIREGEEISPGLRLEKILPDGAIFSYRGEHFRR